MNLEISFTCYTKNKLKIDHRLKDKTSNIDKLALFKIKNFWSVKNPFKRMERQASGLEKIPTN